MADVRSGRSFPGKAAGKGTRDASPYVALTDNDPDMLSRASIGASLANEPNPSDPTLEEELDGLVSPPSQRAHSGIPQWIPSRGQSWAKRKRMGPLRGSDTYRREQV